MEMQTYSKAKAFLVTYLLFQCSKIVVITSLVWLFLARSIVIAQETSSDLLAYTHYDGKTFSLMLYNIDNQISVTVLTSVNYINVSFSLSADGRLAYSSSQGDRGEIYLLDTRADDPKAINIIQMPLSLESPLAWSPDGRYLAFVSKQSEKTLLYIWDGETIIDITPEGIADTAQANLPAWSDDGRLAFTAYFGYTPQDTPNEIYLWDGDTTTSLSQNPSGIDNGPVWNRDGQVAFLSESNTEYDIYLWDGVSVKDGSPDLDTFINVEPQLTGILSLPTWTNTGLLSFLGTGSQDKNEQIYIWDGQTATNISPDRTQENGIPQWSSDGRLAFVPLLNPQPLLYVYDAENRPLLTVATQSSPAWSSGGYLMFCTPKKELSIWDGQTITRVTESGDIVAKWENGNSTFCSSGSAS